MRVILFRWRGNTHRAKESVDIQASIGERGHEGAPGVELDALSKRDRTDHLPRTPYPVEIMFSGYLLGS